MSLEVRQFPVGGGGPGATASQAPSNFLLHRLQRMVISGSHISVGAPAIKYKC